MIPIIHYLEIQVICSLFFVVFSSSHNTADYDVSAHICMYTCIHISEVRVHKLTHCYPT